MEQEIKQINETLDKIHQWQNNHQIVDSDFQDKQNDYHDKLDIKLERLISSVDGLKDEMQIIKDKMSTIAWFTNTSEGVSKIDKRVLTTLLLIAMFVLFGAKAVIGTILAFFNIKFSI